LWKIDFRSDSNPPNNNRFKDI